MMTKMDLFIIASSKICVLYQIKSAIGYTNVLYTELLYYYTWGMQRSKSILRVYFMVSECVRRR